MGGAILTLLFGIPIDQLWGLAGWTTAGMLAWQLATNHGARELLAGWARRRWNIVWPRGGEVAATSLAVFVWNRLVLPDQMPSQAYAWVVGASGVLVWLTRRWASRWRFILAPAAALPPILILLAGTPSGQPAGRLTLLVGLVLAANASHCLAARGRGVRSAGAAWLWFLGLTGLWLGEPLLNAKASGAGDAHWYAMVMADAIAQSRAGLFPPLIGQSQYAFNGSTFPGSFACYYQFLGVGLDRLAGGALPVYAIQHLTVILSLLGGIYSAYGVLRALAPGDRSHAALIAVLYAACPAWLGAIYSMDMYMTVMTLPWLPLVYFGCLRTFIRIDARSILWLVAPLSVVWYAHPPVALWTTLAVAGVQLLRLSLRRHGWRSEALWLIKSATLFSTLTCLPFVTSHYAKPRADVFRHDYVIQTLDAHWAAAWQPVSRGADRLSDQQLGWSLALVALVGGYWAWRKAQRATGAAVAGSAVLFLLLIPVPFIQGALWNAVPLAVKSVTNNWPSQRIYPVLAAAAAVAGGVGLLRFIHRSRLSRRWVTASLCLAATWSLTEAAKFRHRAHLTTLSLDASERQLAPENIALTRYAYEMFARKPDYAADGVMSPLLQHRLLEEDSLAELESNLVAAGAGPVLKTLDVEAVPTGRGDFQLSPALHLKPGCEYLLDFVFAQRELSGSLLLRGTRVDRTYQLPSDGGIRAFGSGPGQGKSIVLWTGGAGPETVQWSFQPRDEAAILPRLFAQVQIREINRQQLPVQLDSLVPYRAVTHATAPAWLETVRMYVPGYVATVNGRVAETRESAEGLLLVKVPAGPSRVELHYAGPPLVHAAGYIAGAAWLGLLLLLAIRAFKLRLPVPFTPPDSYPHPRPVGGGAAVRG